VQGAGSKVSLLGKAYNSIGSKFKPLNMAEVQSKAYQARGSNPSHHRPSLF
jgi:hypothetical protein